MGRRMDYPNAAWDVLPAMDRMIDAPFPTAKEAFGPEFRNQAASY